MAWTIGVDVGGTFTDFFAFEDRTGVICLSKTSSTPGNPAEAVITGLKQLITDADICVSSLSRVSHGTTVGTNALIQRKGGKVALVTTRGFRDLLEIGRQTRPHMFSLTMDNPPALVPRHRRFEIDERLDAQGEVLTSPDPQAMKTLAQTLKDEAVDSVAIGFLFAFLNPHHEQLLAETLRAAGLHVPLSLSSQVQPEFREYERFSTTVLNAYLQPVMDAYVSTLENEVSTLAPAAKLGINQSSGGLMSANQTRAFPVRTALSGPAAGAVGAAFVARQTERPNVITLDMGGTSADVALIRDYQADISFERDVAGFPIRLPAVDIETVGAGGGSIAWFDRDGLMKVGPQSAGADPGPACYGLGGTLPTVTDANLVLGRLSPKGLLGGDMKLDLERAQEAFGPLSGRLGFPLEKTAHGVLGIVVANMVRTIRTISVERGHDPRQFSLMAFGGAGPLHARDVAASLGVREVIVPLAPGIVCAQGLIVSDLKEDFVSTLRVGLEHGQEAVIKEQAALLIDRARAWFGAESIPQTRQQMALNADARYVGQNFELAVELSSGQSIASDALPSIDAIKSAFFQAHEKAYGYASTDDAVEIMNFRLTARGRLHDLENTKHTGTSTKPAGPTHHRPVCFDGEKTIETPVFDRDSLTVGQSIPGPAIIDQLDATTVLFPNDNAVVMNGGNLCITLETAR